MFRKYFVTGLLLWVPLAITLWVLSLIVSTMDQTLSLLPRAWHPHTLIGHDIPGLGLVLTVVVVFVTGLLTANFVGSRLVTLAELALARIPIVRGIYSSVKQVSDTILSPNGNAFRKALLIQYPRVGSWSVAFMTGTPTGEIVERTPGRRCRDGLGVPADDAESDLGFLHDHAPRRMHRTRDDGRCGAEVRGFDGRRGADREPDAPVADANADPRRAAGRVR